ncbi:MAG: putative toxin-antitoxin system toxin component, PIN family [Microbacteriaceae bacterium]|nr:MAG: putative toxin-antitoxin system toxin component, PIN family [Microbacteriaceae bacterium]
MRRVLVDTNVVVSALIFPGSRPARALWTVIETERLVLTQWILDELRDVVGRKWPDRLSALDLFLGTVGYELLDAGSPGVEVRDVDDQRILDAAISGNVDVIVTGDKDFFALEIDRPLILTARDYLDSVAHQ